MFQLNREIGIACQQCIKDCPTKVITLEEGKAEIHNDWGCIKCGHCLAICPVYAISTDDYDMEEVIPYEKEKLRRIIEAGGFTQTSTNNQDVSYIVITDKLDEVRDMAYESLRKKGEAILAHMTPETEYLSRYATLWVKMYDAFQEDPTKDRLFFNAPALILVTSPTPLNGGLASSNMELMVDALGLGTFFCGFFAIALQDNPKMQEYLGLTEKNPMISCFVIGYPNVKYERTVPRKKPEIRWM